MAQPIEQQVNGVDKMLYMQSTSGSDGSYKLTVTFQLGTDPDINTVNVQNKANLAIPQLPDEVSRQGLTIKKVLGAPGVQPVLAEGHLRPAVPVELRPINILDVIKRINGVGDAYLFGPLDYSMRVWLDPQKLANLDISPAEIVSVIQGQNVQAAVGRIGAAPVSPDQQFQLDQHQGAAHDRGRVPPHHRPRQPGRLRGAGRRRRGWSSAPSRPTASPP